MNGDDNFEAHYNSLSPAEAERLAVLMEEMAEAQQVIGKILRHGYNSFNPNDMKRMTNRELLQMELGDVTAILNMMVGNQDLDMEAIKERARQKLQIMGKFLHHNTVESLSN